MFQTFQTSYATVRKTYTDSLKSNTTTDGAKTADQTAFTTYTHDAVNLLAHQVTSAFLSIQRSDKRGRGTDSPLPLVIQRINGATDAKNVAPRQRTKSLDAMLTDAIPAITAGDTTVSLYVAAQEQAIEAVRVSTLNGLRIVKGGGFGNQSKH